jgi:NAD(P)-dependent dehydrogenase (short-subunit alcohol dehydrogenase family)
LLNVTSAANVLIWLSPIGEGVEPDARSLPQRIGRRRAFAARAMMGRIGEPEDVANAVVFLASPESGWITAQVLTVDGGRMDYIGHG